MEDMNPADILGKEVEISERINGLGINSRNKISRNLYRG
jgi:hypothetical protein